jgi:adenylate cyclase
MNYNGLDRTYWTTQRERVESLRLKITQRPTVGDGLVVPEDDALSIGDGRRLWMAVMFIDICDFTGRNMETASEQDLTLRILNIFFTEMIRISEEYGGNVEKNTGDGLLVYFNDDEGNPPESGPKRAVACALTMAAALEHLINPIVVASKAPPLAVRTSIDYGVVTIARIGAPRRFNANAAIGATANFAAKVLRLAKPGDIVIGESAKAKLPIDWQTRFTTPVPESTGWSYRTNNAPYVLYRYTGRWSKLV